MVNQNEGRVGDTPIVGAGTYARDGVVAISCTGEGEAFIKGVVAYDIAARMRYLGQALAGRGHGHRRGGADPARRDAAGSIAVGGRRHASSSRTTPRRCSPPTTTAAASSRTHDRDRGSAAHDDPCGTRSSTGWTSSARPRRRWPAPCWPTTRPPGWPARPRLAKAAGHEHPDGAAARDPARASAATRSSRRSCARRSPSS